MGHIDRQRCLVAAAFVGGLGLVAACGGNAGDGFVPPPPSESAQAIVGAPLISDEETVRGSTDDAETQAAAVEGWIPRGVATPTEKRSAAKGRSAVNAETHATLADNMDPSVDYVGEAACQSCHIGIHSTHVQTGMGRSFHKMRAEIVVGDFTKNNTLTIERTGVHYRMVERDGRYYQQQFLVDETGGEFAAEEHQLLYAVGSGNHNRGYMIKARDGFYQAPVCWYPQADRWELCPGFEHKNDHFSREVSDTCTFCHNGPMVLAAGTRNVWQEPMPEGIDCERCHGPGELHVQKWKKTRDVDRSVEDRTIVNPRNLPREERLAVCLQCHLGDARSTDRVARYGVSLRSFRPGQRLTEVMMPFQYVQKTRSEFGLSSQADRMMMSACYTESGGAMECLTCHDPHVTTYLEALPEDIYNSKCVACHDVDDCVAPMAARDKAEDNCVGCHMRKAEPDDQRFTKFTDHWIRRTIQDEVRSLRSSPAIEPIFPERLAELPAGEQAYYRARANFLLADEAVPAWRQRMLGQAEDSFRQAIEAGFDNAESRFFRGKTLVSLGRPQDGLKEFAAALQHQPEYRDAAFALAQTLSEIGRPSESLAAYGQLLTRYPNDAMGLAEYGRVAWSLRKFREALAAYEKAVELEPRNATYWMNLGMVLSTLGRFEEASLIGERALALDPDNERIWYFYANVMREAGRPAEARKGQLRLERLTRDGP